MLSTVADSLRSAVKTQKRARFGKSPSIIVVELCIFFHLKLFIKHMLNSRHCACPLGCRHEQELSSERFYWWFWDSCRSCMCGWKHGFLEKWPVATCKASRACLFHGVAPGPSVCQAHSSVLLKSPFSNSCMSARLHMQEIFQPNKAPKTCNCSWSQSLLCLTLS